MVCFQVVLLVQKEIPVPPILLKKGYNKKHLSCVFTVLSK
jgi:hypothetical protein